MTAPFGRGTEAPPFQLFSAGPRGRPEGSGHRLLRIPLLCPHYFTVTYLLTFSCYGARLHGDERGSVNRNLNCFGGAFIQPCARLAAAESSQMRQSHYQLDAERRGMALESVLAACARRGWTAMAVHVRETHVHAVVDAGERPESVLTALKAYASRALNEAGLDGSDRRRWSRHGSTIYLWKREDVARGIRYVVDEQGAALEVFENQEP
jgi:REP element-mobilizing transposase RayT